MFFWCEVQFYLYKLFARFPECQEWSAAPISAAFAVGHVAHLHVECYAGGESLAAPRVNLAPTRLTPSTMLDRPQARFFKS